MTASGQKIKLSFSSLLSLALCSMQSMAPGRSVVSASSSRGGKGRSSVKTESRKNEQAIESKRAVKRKQIPDETSAKKAKNPRIEVRNL